MIGEIIAWAWRRDPSVGWALGHIEPTQANLHLTDKPDQWAKVEVRPLFFGNESPEIEKLKIERIDGFERAYIPLSSNWEVQTKGNGSSFRIAERKQDGERFLIPEWPFLHERLERMAREVNAESVAQAEKIAKLERENESLREELKGATAQWFAVSDDAQRWRFGKLNGFPQYCSHDDSMPKGECWYMELSLINKGYASADEAIDAARNVDHGDITTHVQPFKDKTE